MFDRETLQAYDLLNKEQGAKRNRLITQLISDMKESKEGSKMINEEIASSKGNNGQLQEKVQQDQEVITARIDKLLGL